MDSKPRKMRKIAQIVESFAYGTAKSSVQLCRMLDDSSITFYYGVREGTDREITDADSSINWVPLPGKGATRHLTNLRFLIKHLDPQTEIIHGQSTYGGAYAKFVGLFHRKPQVFYSPRGFSFLRENLPRPLRWSFWLFEKITAPLCLTIACGPSEYRIARSLSTRVRQINNAGVVPDDVDVARIGSGILTVGRVGPQKGFDLFLDIARKTPESQFTWIGEPDPGFEHWTDELPANVELIPGLPHHEVLERLRDCRFVLLPSRWEGLSRFLIETLCHGKAFVTSTCAANVDCLRRSEEGDRFENGYSCKTLDEYAAAIQKLEANDEELLNMQSASLDYAMTEFSLDVVRENWRELYGLKTSNQFPALQEQS